MGTTGMLFNTNVVTKVTGLSLWQQMRPNMRAVASVLLMVAVLAPMDAFSDKGSGHWTIALNLGVLIAACAVVYSVATKKLLARRWAVGKAPRPKSCRSRRKSEVQRHPALFN